MDHMSDANRVLLQCFADAPRQTLYADDLRCLYDDPEREERIRVLKALGMIAVADTETRSLGNGVCLIGHPIAWRITVKGRDYLSACEQQLDQQRQQKAELQAKERVQRAQALLDKKHEFRHDFKVAAFTVAATLFLEHLPDVLKLLHRVLEMLGVLSD